MKLRYSIPLLVVVLCLSGVAWQYIFRALGYIPRSVSTLPTVIATVRGCDILRGVDQGHRYYVADCRPDRLSQGEVMP